MLPSRRRLLIQGIELAAFAAASARAGFALPRAGARDERVLVVLQLTGANDGLNTVVPHRQDAYFRLRPTLGQAPNTLHRLDDAHGLHGALAGLGQLFADGRLAVVHGVGYAHPNRSHFRSMEIWHTAEPDRPAGDTGWLGRVADRLIPADPSALVALHLGSESLPRALWSRRCFATSVREAEGFRLATPHAELAEARAAAIARRSEGELGFLREAARSTYRAAQRMEELSARPSKADYPRHELARKLQLAARLIAGRFGTRVFYLTHEGYDTHARQAPAHAALLGELGGALLAFQRDLEACGEAPRVATLVFSEFGRRVEENGSKGTDHGAGAPLFVLGAGIAGGMHGTAPDLARLEEGDVPYSTDFRAVYAALEQHWLGLPASGAVAPLRGLVA